MDSMAHEDSPWAEAGEGALPPGMALEMEAVADELQQQAAEEGSGGAGSG